MGACTRAPACAAAMSPMRPRVSSPQVACLGELPTAPQLVGAALIVAGLASLVASLALEAAAGGGALKAEAVAPEEPAPPPAGRASGAGGSEHQQLEG